MALGRKEAARDTLRDLVFKAFELEEAVKSSGCTEETRKAHSDAQKMVEAFKATVKRREAEIRVLEEEEKILDDFKISFVRFLRHTIF